LVIDEAYVNFIGDPDYDLSRFAAESENVVLLRTLSKGYGLAGLRFGYGIGPRHLIEPMLHKTRDSYNLDAISQALATVAIKDQAYAQDNWHKISQHREDLVQQLRQIGFDCLPSQANFVLATVPQTSPISADLIYRGLKAHNILVRYFPDERLADKLRITVGRPEEHARLMTALSQLLDSHA
jgi:histidinol-phosphate aminotransferase